MPRHPRLDLPGVPRHVEQRGNSRQACLLREQDNRCHLLQLHDAAWLLPLTVCLTSRQFFSVHRQIFSTRRTGSSVVGALVVIVGRILPALEEYFLIVGEIFPAVRFEEPHGSGFFLHRWGKFPQRWNGELDTPGKLADASGYFLDARGDFVQ